MIRLITFDVTGTLMRHVGSAGDQYARALEKHFDISCSSASLEKSFRECYREHSLKSPLFGRKHGLLLKQWWSSVYFGTVAGANIPIAKDCITQTKHESGVTLWTTSKENCSQHILLENSFNDVFWNFEWEPVDHAKEMLQFIESNWKCLPQKQVVVGVISNNDGRVNQYLHKTGLGQYIDFIVTSHEFGIEKPDPRIFNEAKEKASKLLQEKQPLNLGEVLHIGDSLDKDYAGAVSAGCKALLLDPTGKHSKSGHCDPLHCVPDLKNACNFLKHAVGE